MSLIDFTHKGLVKGVNAANNLTLTLNDVTFSKPRENTVGYLTGNTLIRMASRNLDNVDGSTVLSYDRVPLSVIANAVGGKIAIPA